ncbi:hypothetical protein B0H16DRAFT_1706245 [Mycena metata]|uniref:Uncharacterized protein n=1 Tax=Mycena metata TaxID=1033252 RepID=A0AAD7DQF7_9AGAR|nr:hypothetical protein B0H16DRAFT_1706245 [Mycena metata]
MFLPTGTHSSLRNSTMDDPTIYLRENGWRGGLRLRILGSCPSLHVRRRRVTAVVAPHFPSSSRPRVRRHIQIDDLPHEPRLRGAVWIPDPSQDPCALLARSGASYSTSISLAMCDDVASDSLHRGCDSEQRPGMQGHAPAPGAVRASAAFGVGAVAMRRERRCWRHLPVFFVFSTPHSPPPGFCASHETRTDSSAFGIIPVSYIRPILVAFSCHRRRRHPDALIAIVRMRISEHVVDHDGGNGLGVGNYIRMNLRLWCNVSARKKLGAVGSKHRRIGLSVSLKNKTFSWIWTNGGGPGDDEAELHKSVRVEWSKAKARRERWEEEVELLREEMKRVLRFLRWRAVTGVPRELAAGLAAYAARQAALHREIAWRFKASWDKSAATAVRVAVREDGLLMESMAVFARAADGEGESSAAVEQGSGERVADGERATTAS